MRDLPTGTVTFLFTDIEGSTRLLHELGDAYAEALTKHRQVLREAFAAHGGVEVDTQGDAFFYAFPTAPGALAAAREGQEALAQGPIRVRMGLHTGKAQRTEEGYVRIEVHKGARIASAAHGGQVVLSGETRAQLVEVLALSDLGEHRVKDFAEPVWIYQLGDERFPPLKTISNTNLPRPVSSFVGREREVSEVVSLLQDGARLVTLSGPGGSGKTRGGACSDCDRAGRSLDDRPAARGDRGMAQEIDYMQEAFESTIRDRTVAAARAALGEDAYQELAREGAALNLDEAVEVALATID